MERATPLADVIGHLPTEVVDALNRYGTFVQVGVLSSVREFVSDCEAQGVVFDPVTYESVLKAIAPMLVGHHLLIEGLMAMTEAASEKAADDADARGGGVVP